MDFEFIRVSEKFFDVNNKLWTKTENKERACSACGGFINAIDKKGNITHFCYDDLVLSFAYAGAMTEAQRKKFFDEMTY